MKKYIAFVAIPLVIAVVIWLIFSFCAWDINPRRWHSACRLAAGMLCLAVSVFALIEYDTHR